MYYNTTDIQGSELTEAIEKAETGKLKVLAFFKANPGKFYTPFAVHAALFNDARPITSTRRCMTDLTNEGVLYRSNVQEIEKYGAKNYTWSLIITDPSGQTKIC